MVDYVRMIHLDAASEIVGASKSGLFGKSIPVYLTIIISLRRKRHGWCLLDRLASEGHEAPILP